MTEFTQDGKQLRIDTKLAADKLLLIGIDGQEAISTPFSYRVEMLSPDHNIKAEDVIGSMARVSMAKDPEAADFDRRFNGFFASFVRGPKNGKRKELRHYSGELVPWFALLQHSSNCRIFQDKTVAEVIEKTLNDALERHFESADFRSKCFDATPLKRVEYPKLEFCVQYNETDFNFVSRLMEEYGIFYFFEHSPGFPGFHKMVLCPDRSVFGATGTHEVRVTQGTITKFMHRFSFRAGHYAQTDFDFRAPNQPDLESTARSIFPIPRPNPTEHFVYPGRYQKKSDGDKLTIMRVEEEETQRHAVEGSGGDMRFEAGRTFVFRKPAPESEVGKSYILTSVHFLAVEGSYTEDEPGEMFVQLMEQAFDGAKDKVKDGLGEEDPNILGLFKVLPGPVLGKVFFGALNTPWLKAVIGRFVAKHKIPILGPIFPAPNEVPPYTNTFKCVPIETAFRPVRGTAKPRIYGPQTATVMGETEDEEIQIDEHGRIKVRFHWDREHKKAKAGDTSCFMRVSQLWAGSQWGGQFIPRAGMEAIVEFLEGDPDRPIVTGCVYNGNNKTPFTLKKYKSQSGIKTRTTPAPKEGKEKFNMLRFDDAASAEQVLVRSQRRFDLRALGSMYETNHGSRHMVVGWKGEEEQGGDLSTTVGNDQNHHINGGIYARAEKDLNLTVVGATVMDLQGSAAVLVGGKAELNAKEVIVEAAQRISLKVGGNFIVIDASGITIVGTTVKINSGGNGVETGDPSIEDPCDALVSDTGEPGWIEKHKGGGAGPCRQKRKLRSQHFIAPPRPGEPAAMTAIRNQLQYSAAGRHALEVYDRAGVQATTGATGAGSFYTADTNAITIDPSDTTPASTFVHEMNHAEYKETGQRADPTKETKENYVNKKIDEDAHGTALENQAHNELAESGHPEAGTLPGKSTYDTASAQGAADYKAAHPTASPEEIDRAGKAAGEKALVQDYKNGNFTTSTSSGTKTYDQHYGEIWDGANPGAPAAPAPGGSAPAPVAP